MGLSAQSDGDLKEAVRWHLGLHSCRAAWSLSLDLRQGGGVSCPYFVPESESCTGSLSQLRYARALKLESDPSERRS